MIAIEADGVVRNGSRYTAYLRAWTWLTLAAADMVDGSSSVGFQVTTTKPQGRRLRIPRTDLLSPCKPSSHDLSLFRP